MQHTLGILIWPSTVICWRSYNGDLRGLLKGITGQQPVCLKMLHYLGRHDLKDHQRDLRLALLYKIVTGHVAIHPDQTSLVAADNSRTRANHRYKFRAIPASSTGLRYSFAVRTVSDWNQLPAVDVKQETPAAFKAQLARSKTAYLV